jgi:hypothetical protein
VRLVQQIRQRRQCPVFDLAPAEVQDHPAAIFPEGPLEHLARVDQAQLASEHQLAPTFVLEADRWRGDCQE